MLNTYYQGNITGLDQEPKTELARLVDQKPKGVFLAKPSWVTWVVAIVMIPVVLVVPVAGLIFFFVDPPEPGLALFITLFGLLFSIPVIAAWRNIVSRGKQMLAVTSSAFIEKNNTEITIIPWTDLKDEKVEMGKNGVPELHLDTSKGVYIVKMHRSLRPLSTSVNPLTYRFHLLFSIFRLHYPLSQLGLKREIERARKKHGSS